ncbi:MAG TPA: glycoside hydrolase family 3 N-terminal domain-containing protein [Gaiellaceae bacterium]|nr:glycoside hydrolase family 3 N-terminal domain-containing protein [Gaiellaceae bacterium]
MLAALVQALTLLLAGSVEAEVAALTPREKAAALVISGAPAPAEAGGVFLAGPHDPRPRGRLLLVDQEGGLVKDLPALPPWRAARDYRTAAEARAAGRETGRALRRASVHVNLAPVLDAPTGPLGSRHFRSPDLGVAFGRGVVEGGAGACAKHFPGLGSTRVSTDDRPRVDGRLLEVELRAFRAAIRAGIPCVMVGHAFYRELGPFRASLEPATYRMLRRIGFRGIVLTDSMNIVASPPAYWPTRAIRAGADMLLYTSAPHARAAIDALVPLARRGELDAKVVRVTAWKRSLGVPARSR